MYLYKEECFLKIDCPKMVKIGLQFKADLENITNLHPVGEDFRWYIRLKCISCGEETHEFQYLTLTENAPLKGGRGHASLVIKCKLCHRENSIDILKDTIKPYNAEDSGNLKTVVVFDCRGVEPVDFSPRVGYAAEGAESGTPFPEVELTEGLLDFKFRNFVELKSSDSDKEWCDYDEKGSVPVGINELGHGFVTVK